MKRTYIANETVPEYLPGYAWAGNGTADTLPGVKIDQMVRIDIDEPLEFRYIGDNYVRVFNMQGEHIAWIHVASLAANDGYELTHEEFDNALEELLK